MKVSATVLLALAFLCKSYAYDNKGEVATIDDEKINFSAARYEGEEPFYLTFEDEKKIIDKQFDDAKSKHLYPEMKRLAIYSIDLLEKHTAEQKMNALVAMRQAQSIEPWMVGMLNSLNAERSKKGYNPLCLNAKLMAAAWKHSIDLGEGGAHAHTGSDGSTIEERVRRENYPGGWAENVSQGQANYELAMKAFMGSTVHRENILWGPFNNVGLAWYREKGGNMYMWVQVFGSTRAGKEPCITTSVQPPSGGGGSSGGGSSGGGSSGGGSSGGGSGGGSCAGKSKFKTKAKRDSQCKTKCNNKGKSSYEYSNNKCYCC